VVTSPLFKITCTIRTRKGKTIRTEEFLTEDRTAVEVARDYRDNPDRPEGHTITSVALFNLTLKKQEVVVVKAADVLVPAVEVARPKLYVSLCNRVSLDRLPRGKTKKVKTVQTVGVPVQEAVATVS